MDVPPRFRARAFCWNGSRLARRRLQEAPPEIQQVAQQDPLQTVGGAIRLIEQIRPALEQVDSSSGALGNATCRTVASLIDLLVAAPAEPAPRAKWLDHLWEAFNDDGGGYVYSLAERWGELCASAEVAGQWADTLVPVAHSCREERTRSGTFPTSTELRPPCPAYWHPDDMKNCLNS